MQCLSRKKDRESEISLSFFLFVRLYCSIASTPSGVFFDEIRYADEIHRWWMICNQGFMSVTGLPCLCAYFNVYCAPREWPSHTTRMASASSTISSLRLSGAARP